VSDLTRNSSNFPLSASCLTHSERAEVVEAMFLQAFRVKDEEKEEVAPAALAELVMT